MSNGDMKNETGNFYKNTRLQFPTFSLEGERNVKITLKTLPFLTTFHPKTHQSSWSMEANSQALCLKMKIYVMKQ